MSKEYLNDADEFLDGGAEKGVVRTCRNCASYYAEAWHCNDQRTENEGYMCNPDTPGCWYHCTMADAVKVKVKVAIIREKRRLANMTATDKRIEALEMTNRELLEALETLLSECERVDYKPTQPLRFLSYDPDVIRKAFNAIRKAEVNVEVTK